MARILCIDYGSKRCGIAATDPFQIIVSAIGTVDTSALMEYLGMYLSTEKVEKLVIGLPVHKDGNFTQLKPEIDQFVHRFRQKFEGIDIDFADEQFSSVHAKQIILDIGIKKEKRKDKALVDKISAVVILQRYLKHI
jgi:putative Holliday junction resolvase